LAGGFAGKEAVIVRFRMAALEVLEAGAAVARNSGSGDNAAEFFRVRKNGQQPFEHALRGFADGEDAEIGKDAEVELATGATQGVTRNGKTALDGGAGIDGLERAVEDLARKLFRVHRIEYRRESQGRKSGIDGSLQNCGS